jgi:hypothetical protein
LDAERAHAAVKMTAIDAHQLGRARDVSVCFLEFSLNKLAMIGLGRVF